MKVTFLITTFLSSALALPILSKMSQSLTSEVVFTASPIPPVVTDALTDESGDDLIPYEGITQDNNDQAQQQEILSDEEDFFYIQPERLAQVIATHIQFDHLDAVISNTDKVIASEFQHHIQINLQNNNNDEKSKLMSHNANQYADVEMMDLEILQSQISAAIQAHTEGNLPLAWDKFAEKLGREAIESYIRQSLGSYCGDDGIIPTTCLNEHAVTLANSLDDYVINNLKMVFDALDQFALPDLLQHTARDLKGILDYFNESLLDNKKFTLDVMPWNNNEVKVHSFKSKLLAIALPAQPKTDDDDHSTAFFKEFLSMARV